MCDGRTMLQRVRPCLAVVLADVLGVQLRRLRVGGRRRVGVGQQGLDGDEQRADVVDGAPQSRAKSIMWSRVMECSDHK
jgi:hypothetical protein